MSDIFDDFDKRIERIKALGLDDGELVIADLWKVRSYALDARAQLAQPSIVPEIVGTLQRAVAQIDYALTDTRIQECAAAVAWLRTIKEGIQNSSGDVGAEIDKFGCLEARRGACPVRSADEIDTCDEIRAAWSRRAGHAERRAGTRCTRPEMRVDVRALLAACDSLADALEAAQRENERQQALLDQDLISVDEFVKVRAERDAAVAREARLRAAVEDLATHGLRADLNPTVMFGDESHVYRQLTDYLRRLDAAIRDRARAALASVPPETQPEAEQ